MGLLDRLFLRNEAAIRLNFLLNFSLFKPFLVLFCLFERSSINSINKFHKWMNCKAQKVSQGKFPYCFNSFRKLSASLSILSWTCASLLFFLSFSFFPCLFLSVCIFYLSLFFSLSLSLPLFCKMTSIFWYCTIRALVEWLRLKWIVFLNGLNRNWIVCVTEHITNIESEKCLP